MRYIGHRASETNPLRSLPLFRPAPVRMTALALAEWELAGAAAVMPNLERQYAYARQVLGEANRRPRIARRRFQSLAMSFLNKARAQLRRARIRLAMAEAAVAALRLQPSLVHAA